MAKQPEQGQTHADAVDEYDSTEHAIGRIEHSTIIEGRGPVSTREQMQLRDRQERPLQRHLTFLYRCDQGHYLSEQNRASGECHLCGALLCQARGCTYSCYYCGNVMCREHAVIDSSNAQAVRIFCRHCRWAHFRNKVFGF